MSDDLLSISTVSRLFSTSRGTIYKAIEDGSVPAFKNQATGIMKIRRDDAEEYFGLHPVGTGDVMDDATDV